MENKITIKVRGVICINDIETTDTVELSHDLAGDADVYKHLANAANNVSLKYTGMDRAIREGILEAPTIESLTQKRHNEL